MLLTLPVVVTLHVLLTPSVHIYLRQPPPLPPPPPPHHHHQTSRGKFRHQFRGDMVSSAPHLTTFNLPRYREHTRDEFIVLGCDGLFDVMEKQDVVDFVSAQLEVHADVQRATEALVDHAIDVKRSTDNVTVVIVCLGQFAS